MTIPEAALVESLGGTVQVLPYVDGCSTTATIRRIQQAADCGYRGQRAGLP
jgi:bifunctional ADP-heptose synthase (sugar kinase/adenylyltransferase)